MALTLKYVLYTESLLEYYLTCKCKIVIMIITISLERLKNSDCSAAASG